MCSERCADSKTLSARPQSTSGEATKRLVPAQADLRPRYLRDRTVVPGVDSSRGTIELTNPYRFCYGTLHNYPCSVVQSSSRSLRRTRIAMKRYLQLVGEMKQYRLSQAKLALQELVTDDELVVVVPEQSLAGEIQQWATSQGLTVAPPKKMLDGLTRWQLSIKKAVPAPAVEAKPAAATPAAAPTPAATPSPATKPAAPAASAPAAAPTPTPAPAATATPAPAASSTSPATPAASGTPAATPTPAAAPAPADRA